jgi:hypothetical protein
MPFFLGLSALNGHPQCGIARRDGGGMQYVGLHGMNVRGVNLLGVSMRSISLHGLGASFYKTAL